MSEVACSYPLPTHQDILDIPVEAERIIATFSDVSLDIHSISLAQHQVVTFTRQRSFALAALAASVVALARRVEQVLPAVPSDRTVDLKAPVAFARDGRLLNDDLRRGLAGLSCRNVLPLWDRLRS